VLEPGATLDADALRAHCRTILSAYKVPKHISVVDDLPRSLVGKVLRRIVREELIGGSR
jgi:long-chain acyl-CoA synthetase